MYCNVCGKECEGQWIDEGIGSYEYWGAKYNDVRWVYVSDCCEGDLFENQGLTIPADWPEPQEDESLDRRSDEDY